MKQQVEQIVRKLNSKFTAKQVSVEGMTRDQITKAIRTMKNVTSLGNGKYRQRGRKVNDIS